VAKAVSLVAVMLKPLPEMGASRPTGPQGGVAVLAFLAILMTGFAHDGLCWFVL
jgi:hypothetical protein